MKEEKKQFQQQISSLKSDNQRMRTQTETLKSDLSKTQGELVGLKVKCCLGYYNSWYSVIVQVRVVLKELLLVTDVSTT